MTLMPKDPALRAALVALVVGLGITGTLAARNGWDSFIDHDAVQFHAVALDLDASEATAGNSAFRYGRIGLPLLARMFAFGDPDLVSAAQMLVTPLAAALLVGAAVALARRTSGRWTDGLVVLLVPGLWVGFAYAWADTLLAACVVLSLWATIDGRRWLTVGAIAGAALTKEVGVLAALPAVGVAFSARELGRGAEWLAALLPAALWWSWVRVQAGEWPFLADEPARARAISPPLVDIIHALTGGPGDRGAGLLALLVGAIGAGLVLRRPSSPLAWSAGAWGVVTLCLGDNVLRYPGDTLRVMTPAMSVIFLAAVVLQRDGSTAEPSPTGR
jgi:hypothetical protein